MLLNKGTAKPTGDLPNPPYDPTAKPPYDPTANPLTYCVRPDKLNSAWPALGTLANALGQFINSEHPDQQADPDSNTVVAAYTVTDNNREDPKVKPLVELKMVQPVKIPTGGRYVTFSVAMAASSCKATTGEVPGKSILDPTIDFYFIKDPAGDTTPPLTGSTNSNLIKLNGKSSSPCWALNAQTIGAAKVARLAGDTPVYLDQNSLSMMFVNSSINTNGNDAAFDDIKVLDVSPQAYKSFGSTSVVNHGKSRLTFYIVNTTVLPAIPSWSLTDVLPTGMTLAATPNTVSSCTPSPAADSSVISLTASDDRTTLTLKGSLSAGTESCQVAMDVDVNLTPALTSTRQLVNGDAGATPGAPGSIVTERVLTPDAATLDVTPQVDMAATGGTPVSVVAGYPVSVTTSCTNNGLDTALAASCSVNTIEPGASTACTLNGAPVTGPVDMVAGATMVCTTQFTPTTTGTVNLETVASTTSVDTNPANDRASTPVVITAPQADMQATAPTTFDASNGVPVSIPVSCRNAGPQPAVAANCVVGGNVPADAIVICQPAALPTQAPLAVGDVISCTVNFTPKTSGALTFTTTASSTTTDPDLTNNGKTTTLNTSPTADMQADAPPSVPVIAGKETTATSTCTNNGPDDAVAATCTVSGAPEGAKTSCTPASATTLKTGEQISCTTTFTPKDTTPITLKTTASSTTLDPNSKNNEALTEVAFPGTALNAVPTLSEWAQIALFAGLAALGVLGVRRYKRN